MKYLGLCCSHENNANIIDDYVVNSIKQSGKDSKL